jgi:hypothetical protein
MGAGGRRGWVLLVTACLRALVADSVTPGKAFRAGSWLRGRVGFLALGGECHRGFDGQAVGTVGVVPSRGSRCPTILTAGRGGRIPAGGARVTPAIISRDRRCDATLLWKR